MVGLARRATLARAAQLWKQLDDPRFEEVTAALAATDQAG